MALDDELRTMTKNDMLEKPQKKSLLDADKVEPAASVSEVGSISGRGVFAVQVVNGGVAVRSAMLVDGDRLLEMPAIFPDVHYAMAQIDELKTLVARHFAEAAHLGTQLIAAQAQAQIQAQSAPSETANSSQADALATTVKP